MSTTIRRLASACAAKPLLLAFAALPLSGPAQAGTDFILANSMDAANIQNVASRAFIEKLEELSGGEIKVEHHPGQGRFLFCCGWRLRGAWHGTGVRRERG